MFDKPDAHKSPVTAITSLDSHLYSGANKCLKVWDIKTMQCVNEIVKDIGVGCVKSIVIQKQRKLLIATSGKDIMMWDL